MQVRLAAALSPSCVFNLTSPRYIPEVSRGWADWHDPKYEPIRDMMESEYVTAFNKFSSHYTRLEDSIAREGIRNPVMLTSGPLLRRKAEELPPAVLADPGRLVCEWLGGSRLYVAAKMGIMVPAIINDFAGLEYGELIPTGTDLKQFFKDQPKQIYWLPNGCAWVQYLPYSHFPERERTGAQRAQQDFRRDLIAKIQFTARKMRKEIA